MGALRDKLRDGVGRLGHAWAELRIGSSRNGGMWSPGGGYGGGGGQFLMPGTRAYEAAKLGRRDMDFTPQNLGPNALAEAFGGSDLIVARVRHLVDNNPLVAGAVDTFCANIVGTGIDDCEPDTGFADVDDQISHLWEWAIKRVDPERQMTVGESQRLACRELFAGGEAINHYPMAEAFRGWPTMPAIEIIERERMDTHITGINRETGNRVRQGVEYDSKNRVVAYHVLVANPKDNDVLRGGLGAVGLMPGFSAYPGSPNVRRIPAEDAELAFVSRRVAQLRGIPRATSVIGSIRMEDGYYEDTMWMARLATMLGLFFTGPMPPQLFAGGKDGDEQVMVDATGRPITRMERGTVGFLRQGTELKQVTPAVPTANFESVQAVNHRRQARGLGMTYSEYSGDASRTTFSSMRGETEQARREEKPVQVFLWEHHTEPWRRRLIDWGVLTGRVTLTGAQRTALAKRPESLYRCNVGYPGRGYVNPAQEALAVGEDIDNGVGSQIGFIQARGGNWKRVVTERVKFEKFLQDKRKEAGVEAPPVPGAAKPGRKGPDEPADPNTGEPLKNPPGARESRMRRMGLAGQLLEAEEGSVPAGRNGHANGVHHS